MSANPAAKTNPHHPAADIERLQAENETLRDRLQEAEETLLAIQRGDVDALVVADALYTLESANAASNRMRKDVLAQMEDAVFAFDLQGNIVFMNDAAERQYRVVASAALGRARDDVYRDVPDAPPGAHSPVADALGQPQRTVSTHRRADGSSFRAESTLSALRDADNAVIGSLAVIRDIDERVRSEAAIRLATAELAERERQFATLVENSPDIFARIDRRYRHLYVSPVIERYAGVPAVAFIGKTNADMGMPAALCAQWNAALDGVFASGEIGRVRFSIQTAGGETRVFDSRLIPERAPGGSVDSVLSIASDVTEQERIDAALRDSQERLSTVLESLRDADRRKDEFLATLAHELRNPLAPIRNALHVMRRQADPALQAGAQDIIERQLRQMVHLVDDLLDVGRISQGKVELRRHVVDLVQVVQEAIETSKPLIDAGRHRLDVQLPPPGAMMVDADPTRFCQIVANLLNNAAKYTPEGGRISVAVVGEGAGAAISVQDSGVGIQADMLPRVFDMFAQVDRTMERAQGGLGIGLALVKRLVELHGGSVAASSAGANRGSCFVVHMPLLEPQRSATPAVDVPAPEPHAARGCSVLVVDDNRDSASSLAMVLDLVGYHTLQAHDGADAVTAVQAHGPQVAVLDIGLPRLSGHEAARRIRLLPGGRDMLLIALSGWGQAEDRRKSMDAGFDHHLVKPVDFDALLKLVQAGSGKVASDAETACSRGDG